MSNVEINQVLAQMRAMSAVAASETSGPADDAAGPDFGEVMKQSIQQVNEAQAEGRRLATAFESGDPSVELPEVMVALQKASISFQAMSQVRNKLLSAYQEVMNMQV
ncbi:flagellar hook-basal body complex protein FliE [Pseudohalioglobus lutimaris]|uniref:Flagellar hook-basal body complex protein FliE n=1 Tax=Pseudohalioglobus lutimaris TaxID=1737061 RepID=A0A2N5X1C6_9GAMM|nr:flagellar hook-basal body complex protein FliE [Pseudohalioglobus lutimaris]PLW68294.1 flagellar hook-basal body complex protein FliE [Pseudohalioglobus lutimaris]